MESRLKFQINDLENAIRNVKAAYPELTEDEEFLLDVLEGETSLHDVVGKLVDGAREQKAMQDAVGDMIETLRGRQGAWKVREAATRNLILRLLQVAGVRKVTIPQATVSIAAARKTVVIIDETQLPEEAFVVEKRVSKTKLKSLLEEGDVTGAAFSNGGETLTIR